MKLFYDSTESRRGTCLPDNVVAFGQRVVGLEVLTGADMILSPLDDEMERLDEEGRGVLARHCRAGLLVQRKSGMDLVSSLGRLGEIECRMQQWGSAWLLVTGRFSSRNGLAAVNGRRTGVLYQQVIGAVDTWVLRGGGVTWLDEDERIGSWVELMLRKLASLEPEEVVMVGVNRQKLVGAHLATREQAAISTLSTFPGISHVMAQRITRGCGGRLCQALEWLSSNGHGVAGVGPKTIAGARKWLGLKEGEELRLYRVDSRPAEDRITYEEDL